VRQRAQRTEIVLVRGFQRVKQLTIAEEMSAADEASACSRLPDDDPNRCLKG